MVGCCRNHLHNDASAADAQLCCSLQLNATAAHRAPPPPPLLIADQFDPKYNPAPPPPDVNTGCMPPNVTGKYASAYGRYYQLVSTAGGVGADATHVNAAKDCFNTKKGRLAIFKDQYQQWLIESMLLPANTTGVVDMYWTGGVRSYVNGSLTQHPNYMNVSWIWSDTLQFIGPKPRNASNPYSRWAVNQPSFTTAAPQRACVVSTRYFAWDTVGPFPVFERRDGSMPVWAWAVEDCTATRPYICELPCERGCCGSACFLPRLAWLAACLACLPFQMHARSCNQGI